MIRKRKKTRKKRGHEMHSGLRRRGAGNRGGRGNAGQGKKSGGQKQSKRLAKGKRLGKYGFNNPTKKEVKTINLRDLHKHVKGKELDVTELGYDKVLGKGEAPKGLTVKARSFSKTARKKIEKANGKTVVM
ncbi:50S ribosomal protein L15 [archaeon]|nr:50S ribosomal protein L15 [archaeon]